MMWAGQDKTRGFVFQEPFARHTISRPVGAWVYNRISVVCKALCALGKPRLSWPTSEGSRCTRGFVR